MAIRVRNAPMLERCPRGLARHTSAADLRERHKIPQLPQFLASACVLTSQPLAGFPSQSAKPGVQLVVHVPLVQAKLWLAPAEQTLPQAPQFLSSVLVFTSQPVLAARSQSRKPGLHAPMPQRPPVQPGVAFAGAKQLLPQRPQLWVSELVSTQAPLQSIRSCPI